VSQNNLCVHTRLVKIDSQIEKEDPKYVPMEKYVLHNAKQTIHVDSLYALCWEWLQLEIVFLAPKSVDCKMLGNHT